MGDDISYCKAGGMNSYDLAYPMLEAKDKSDLFDKFCWDIDTGTDGSGEKNTTAKELTTASVEEPMNKIAQNPPPSAVFFYGPMPQPVSPPAPLLEGPVVQQPFYFQQPYIHPQPCVQQQALELQVPYYITQPNMPQDMLQGLLLGYSFQPNMPQDILQGLLPGYYPGTSMRPPLNPYGPAPPESQQVPKCSPPSRAPAKSKPQPKKQKEFRFMEPEVPGDFVANPSNHGRWKIEGNGERTYLNASRVKKSQSPPKVGIAARSIIRSML